MENSLGFLIFVVLVLGFIYYKKPEMIKNIISKLKNK